MLHASPRALPHLRGLDGTALAPSTPATPPPSEHGTAPSRLPLALGCLLGLALATPARAGDPAGEGSAPPAPRPVPAAEPAEVPEDQVPDDRVPEDQAEAAQGGSESDAQAASDAAARDAARATNRAQLSPEGDTIIVTATRDEESTFEVPYTTDTVTEDRARRRGYTTLPQMLRDTPGVYVQKTGPAQASPYIRGFNGFRTLLMIDGIRLNNSVFREGPNQYWSTVDPFTVGRLEVVKGPSSVLWGSDAIGGTVNAVTRDPYAWDTGYGGALEYRWGSASGQHTARAEASATNGTDMGVLVGVTFGNWSSITGGDEVGLQPDTGYEEAGADIKFEKYVNENLRLVFAHQHFEQNDAPRTHRTVNGIDWMGLSVGSDLQRNLDQERDLTYLQLHANGLDGVYQSAVTSISWHQQSEVRDRIRGNGNSEYQGFDVNTLGLSQTFVSDTDLGVFTYGAEFYRDTVTSFLDKGAAQTDADNIQGPVADDSSYVNAGVFVQDQIQVSERADVTLGLRWNYAAVDARSVRDPVSDTRTQIEDDWNAFVGSIRFGYDLDPEHWRLFGGISQGFRAPSLSDLTRFDSARTDEFEIPAPGLDPEYYLTYELGVKQRSERWANQVAVYYTDIQDGIVRFPTGNVNGSGDAEISKANVGDGYMYGVELGSAFYLTDNWTTFGNASWQEGKQDTFPTSAPVIESEYISRLMPLRLSAGLRWDDLSTPLWLEFLATWADKADRLNTRDMGDDSRIPPGGTPSYTVLDLRGGYTFANDLSLTLGLENLTDEDYRVHGSGTNMPGRNLYVGMRWNF